MSKSECVHGGVQLIAEEKREPKCRCVESIDFVSLSDVNESIVAYCNFVIVSEFNEYWLTKVLY